MIIDMAKLWGFVLRGFFWTGFPQKSSSVPLKRLQILVSQKFLEIGNTCYDEGMASALLLLKLVPAEILPHIPEISWNPRQQGRYFILWEGCWPETLRNGVSSSMACAVLGMLMAKVCPDEEGNDRIAAAVTPGV